MAFTLQKAERSEAKLKLAIGGPSGSGKTMSSLLLAYGLLKQEHPTWSEDDVWSKICVIDTENRSASLYSGTQVDGITIHGYQTIDFQPPFEAASYIEAITVAENAGMEVVIIDSLSHAWTGVGGALEKQGKIADKIGNSYTAWRTVTPEHNKLVDKMLQSNIHVIANMRAKQEYVQEKGSNGKTQVHSVGMGLQMRDGVEYEFTVCFMLDYNHTANATKDRTGLFDSKYFTITPDTGKTFAKWLSSGVPAAKEEPKPAPKMKKAEAPVEEAPAQTEGPNPMDLVDGVVKAALEKRGREAVTEKIKEICGTVNYRKVTDTAVLRALYKEFKED